MKDWVRYILPPGIIRMLRRFILWMNAVRYNWYDTWKYLNYSVALVTDTRLKLERSIILQYHIMEKGLTMPETRLGFGKEGMLRMLQNIIKYITLYNLEGNQVVHAIGVAHEYCSFHKKNGIEIDSNILNLIKCIDDKVGEVNAASQREMISADYFIYKNASFFDFSNSRCSVRNFTDEKLDVELIRSAIDLARNTPSACNRQSVRDVYSDKVQIASILKIQGGCRGFGHLADKLIVITSELAGWGSLRERFAPYIDGGMFVMNLLYSLHYYGIGVCTLNCSMTPRNDKTMRALTGIPNSEVFVAMLVCGHIPFHLRIASSPRFGLDNIMTSHN